MGDNSWKRLLIPHNIIEPHDLIIKASALTYYTMLAIVPIFALFLAIGKGFGFAETIEGFVNKLIGDNPEITNIVMGFVNNYLDQTQGGLFVGFGIGLLLWAVLNMFRQIEANFNDIWNVKKKSLTSDGGYAIMPKVKENALTQGGF